MIASAVRAAAAAAVLQAAGVAAFIAALPGAHAADAPPAEAAVERERIRTDRAKAQERYAQAVQACRERFAVTACIDDARAERRVVLERLLREQEVVDEVERRRRAGDRLRRIEDKMIDADQRSTTAPAAAVMPIAPIASPVPSTGVVSRQGPRATSRGDAREAEHARDEREARDRRVQHAQQLDDAQAHRQAVEQRRAARQKARKPVEPLPVPPASSLMPASAAGR